MRILRFSYIIAFTILFVMNCSRAPDLNSHGRVEGTDNAQKTKTPPEWFASTPVEDETYIYAVSRGESRDEETAVNEAKRSGKVEISKRIFSHVESQLKSFARDAGMEENIQLTEFYQSSSKTISTNTLSGNLVQKTDSYELSSGVWIAHVQLAIRKSALNNALVKIIIDEKTLYPDFKKSQIFDVVEAAALQVR